VSGPTGSDPTDFDPADPGPTGPDPTASDPTDSDPTDSGSTDSGSTEFVLGRDYTEEDGLVVFTAYYLLGRGKCCRVGCRNCPWGRSPVAAAESQQTGSPEPGEKPGAARDRVLGGGADRVAEGAGDSIPEGAADRVAGGVGRRVTDDSPASQDRPWE
jgi:Family of unknown function (DUF5522)